MKEKIRSNLLLLYQFMAYRIDHTNMQNLDIRKCDHDYKLTDLIKINRFHFYYSFDATLDLIIQVRSKYPVDITSVCQIDTQQIRGIDAIIEKLFILSEKRIFQIEWIEQYLFEQM